MYFTIKQGNARIIGYHRQAFATLNYKGITFYGIFLRKFFANSFANTKIIHTFAMYFYTRDLQHTIYHLKLI